MSEYSLTHVSDQVLLAELAVLITTDRHTTAALLAHIAEVDARTLYLPAACASMHVYCMRVLHLAEDAAFKRIRAARAARRFPQIFGAIADGRLHLSGVLLLAPHLTDDNAEELLVAASHKSKAEIEVLLAQRAPRPDVPTHLEPAPAGSPRSEQAPGPATDAAPVTVKVTPLAPERYALQVTIDQATQEKLMRAQALLRHRVPSGDLAEVLDHALDALLAALERKKFGATTRPRPRKEPAAGTNPRHVPSDVKRAVHARDGEQCTFVSDAGERCGERGFLELDHRTPVARGGQSTVDNIRLRCKPHNQYEAERVFGADFMQSRRTRARTAEPGTAQATAAAGPAPASTAATGPAPAAAAGSGTAGDAARTAPAPAVTTSAATAAEIEADALLGLRGLGFTAAEARAGLARSAHLPAPTLEERVRVALAAMYRPHAQRWQYGDRSGRPEAAQTP